MCVCIDGHNTPVFQEKFVFSLIEGLREINVTVCNLELFSNNCTNKSECV